MFCLWNDGSDKSYKSALNFNPKAHSPTVIMIWLTHNDVLLTYIWWMTFQTSATNIKEVTALDWQPNSGLIITTLILQRYPNTIWIFKYWTHTEQTVSKQQYGNTTEPAIDNHLTNLCYLQYKINKYSHLNKYPLRFIIPQRKSLTENLNHNCRVSPTRTTLWFSHSGLWTWICRWKGPWSFLKNDRKRIMLTDYQLPSRSPS